MSIETMPSVRPRVFLIAAISEAIAGSIAMYKFALVIDWSRPAAPYGYLVLIALHLLWWRGILLGRRWARVLTLWVASLAMFGLLSMWFDPGIDPLSGLQFAFQAIAFVALVQSSARNWRPRGSPAA
jgi:hypothetical protein